MATSSIRTLGLQLIRKKFTIPQPLQVISSRGLHEEDRSSMTVLNEDTSKGILINSYSSAGFRLNNGMWAVGPIAIFPKSVLSWNVNSAADINLESLSLFYLLDPKIDILVIGVGDAGQKLNLEVVRFLREKRIGVEILPTEKACSTFNFLNVEGRVVAGALIPPENFRVTEDDIYTARRNQKGYMAGDANDYIT